MNSHERDVDKLVDEMIARTKGKYITQGVSFNKTCPRQIKLLKEALRHSQSFSGLAKELLALRLSGQPIQPSNQPAPQQTSEKTSLNIDYSSKKKNINDFL
jgi:hypothetical protein